MDFEEKSQIFALNNNYILRKKSVFFRLKSLYYFNKMKREAEQSLKKSGVKLLIFKALKKPKSPKTGEFGEKRF